MTTRKGRVDVVFAVCDGFVLHDVEEALRGLAAQTYASWRLLVVDGTKSDAVRDLVSRFIPADRREYSRSALKSDVGANDLLYEGVCGAKARVVAYLLPGPAWDATHLERLMHEIEEGADIVYMSRDHKLCRKPNSAALVPGNTSIQMVLHKLAHYGRTAGFPRRSCEDPAIALFRQLCALPPAWEPVFAAIPARTAPKPQADQPWAPLRPMKSTQLALFANA